jgi:hypothetical protein
MKGECAFHGDLADRAVVQDSSEWMPCA